MATPLSKQDKNPNPTGICNCSPEGANVDCAKSEFFYVWSAAELDSPTDPYPVLGSACPYFKEVAEGEILESVESSSGPAPDEPNIRWDELTPEEQANIEAAGFDAGTLVSVGTGDRVRIPGGENTERPEYEPPTEPPTPDGPDPLEQLAKDLPEPGELPREEPGPEPGEYVQAEE